MIRPRRLLVVTVSVAAALGAGAVMSSAQAPPAPAPSAAASIAECDRALPAPVNDGTAAFLKVPGIPGESKNPAHAGESNVDTFRFGASNSGAASGAGGGSGKATIRTLVLGKPYDSASPLLLKRVATGQHIPSVTLTQQNAAGVFQTIKLEDVTVVDVEQTSRQRNNAEKVCLKFGFKATVEYRPPLADGTLGAPVSAVLP